MKFGIAWVMGLLALFAVQPAQAQPWPSGPVRMIIPWPTGGGNDAIGRKLADALSKNIGQPVIVDNRGGANGLIGAEAVARAAPDGTTIMFHSVTTHLINPAFYPKVPYDTLGDFAPVSLIGEAAHVLLANPSFAAQSVPELVELARKQPGSVSYASFGSGSSSHLSGELFDTMLRIKMAHVPYKGSGPALTDVMAGHVPLFFSTVAAAVPSIRSGRVKPLAVTSSTRTSLLPEVPTVDEAGGIKGYEMTVMYGVWAPAQTRSDILERLSAEIGKVVKSAEFAGWLKDQGVDARASTPADMASYIRTQMPRLERLVKESGAKAE